MKKRLRETLVGLLSAGERVGVYNSFDIVGDIAIFKVPCGSGVNVEAIAEAIMARHRNVKAVFLQVDGVKGDYRLRGLKYVAGENRTVTVYRESGCCFAVDVAQCYFSPRLSFERMRIARLVQPDEVIVNMFAGVGCFSVIIARHSRVLRVFSIDVNPVAVRFMEENVRRNSVFEKVIPVLGDAKHVIEERLRHCADRVLMPLPEKAFDYLPSAVSALKVSGGWVHVYVFEHAFDVGAAVEKVKQRLTKALSVLGVNFDISVIRVVRSVGPNWFQFVADVHVF
ncbi:MAG: class I SAM-dependent methyltransferase family protein [Candidatus Bathyarchaeia archaeon]